MKVACLYLAFNLLILASSFASAYDPSLLQDFCVAVNDTNNGGDVFVFPIGLIHFQQNVGKINAVAFAGLSSQNP
ncbi:hypothetical protein Goshw_009854, partial [Gossypium schwendimanii]|nr:hypothetical protein [Gossypium schwendimanii]